MHQLFILLSLAINSHAAGIQNVEEVAMSTGTVSTLYVSSGPVDVAASVQDGKVNGAYAIEVYNLAASTNSINCGYDVNVSSITNNNKYGREVAPGNGVVWHVLQGQIKVFCISQNATGVTRATITQIR